MKVLLIQPPSLDKFIDKIFMFEPLALEYLAAGAMEQGHDVRILDTRIDSDFIEIIKRFAPDVVGLTAYTPQVNIVLKLAERIKGSLPKSKVYVGGHHATVKPEDFNSRFIDAVVVGEGVFAFRELLDALENKSSIEEIKGIAAPSDTGLIYTQPRPYTPLDDLPMPARDLTEKYRRHYFSEWFSPLASVRTSLGCTSRCNFCSLWAVTGGKYLKRSFDSIINELKTVGEKNVFFCDDESMCDTKRMDALADRIASEGINKKYFLYARVDTIVRHPELFKKWAAVGLKQVFVGMEDFSDERLRAMKKNISTDQQREAVRILKDCGIMMYASFMVSPDYTEIDFAQLKKYVRELKLTYATFTVMTPLPGTELYKENRGRLLSEKPELFDMVHLLLEPKIPMKKFYEELAKLYSGAVPLYKVLPAMHRFGIRGLMLRIRLLGKFLEKVKNAHLDY